MKHWIGWLWLKKRIKFVKQQYNIELSHFLLRKYVINVLASKTRNFSGTVYNRYHITGTSSLSTHENINTYIYPNKKTVKLLTRIHDSRRMEPHFIEYSRIIANAWFSKAMRRGCKYTINSLQILTNFSSLRNFEHENGIRRHIKKVKK